MSQDSIFISTSIPYVNGPPHVGFAWELVIADVLARYQRLRGADVLFLTGSDDNSLKNVLSAAREGTPTADFVRRQGQRFVALAAALGISNDDFLRTAFDARHAPAVERLWRACAAHGDVDVRPYGGAYCVGCEQFYAANELVSGRCPEHDEPLEHVEESNYFFRLSGYREHIDRLLTSGALRISPDVYRHDAYRWVEAGLNDFSISRSEQRARGWGIAVPGDASQIVYVWFDALANYISALDFATRGARFERFWQGSQRRIHVIGKNLTRFHCVYWPAILRSAQLQAPTDVVVHGFLTVDGRKIGKSLGNGVDPFALVDRFGCDRLRYYLLRHFQLGHDGDFSVPALVQRANVELSGKLGNLLNRVLVLLEQHAGGAIPELRATQTALSDAAYGAAERAAVELERAAPDQALGAVIGYVAACNLAISRSEPWKLARGVASAPTEAERSQRQAELLEVLGDQARALLWIAGLLQPFLPDAAARIAQALGAPAPNPYRSDARADWSTLLRGARTERAEVLFTRVDGY